MVGLAEGDEHGVMLCLMHLIHDLSSCALDVWLPRMGPDSYRHIARVWTEWWANEKAR